MNFRKITRHHIPGDGTLQCCCCLIVFQNVGSHCESVSPVRSGFTFSRISRIISWHVDPLLGNDREISSYTISVAK
jgi:hypothetical protein